MKGPWHNTLSLGMSLDESEWNNSTQWAPCQINYCEMLSYLNHEIDFVATRKVGEIPSRFEMGSLGIRVAFVHFLLASLG